MIYILCQVEPQWRKERRGKLPSTLQQTLASQHKLECWQFTGIREEGERHEDGGGEQNCETGDWCSSIRFTASWTAKPSSSTTKATPGANMTPVDGLFSWRPKKFKRGLALNNIAGIFNTHFLLILVNFIFFCRVELFEFCHTFKESVVYPYHSVDYTGISVPAANILPT
jgi:hypothetical protein